MTARTSLVRFALASVAALVTLASAAQAQSLAPSSRLAAPAAAAPAAQNDSAVAAPTGPTRDGASLAVRPVAEVNRTPAPAERSGFTHSEALMLLGGAAVLTGIVVGNDAGHAISVVGAVVGLYGLYQYLQ